jgi:cold shock CspA family protein
LLPLSQVEGVGTVAERKRGKITFLKRERGYGFLRDDNTLIDYFFAANEIPGLYEQLEVGDSVSFITVPDSRQLVRSKAIQIEKGNE